MVEPTANGTAVNNLSIAMAVPIDKPELTCISEEGIADMDLPENIFNNLNGDCTASCNKVMCHPDDIHNLIEFFCKLIFITYLWHRSKTI